MRINRAIKDGEEDFRVFHENLENKRKDTWHIKPPLSADDEFLLILLLLILSPYIYRGSTYADCRTQQICIDNLLHMCVCTHITSCVNHLLQERNGVLKDVIFKFR